MPKSDRAAKPTTTRILRSPRRVALALLALGVGVACSTPPSPGGTSDEPVAKAAPAFTALTRSAQKLAKPEWDIGRRDPSILAAGSLYFEPTAQQKIDREALLAAVQDPTSPSYHTWLTPEQLGARFGAQPSDIARVTQWLESQGLTIDAPSPLGDRIGFRGPSGQVEAAFHTEFHNYMVGGKKHFAMASAPTIPTEFAPIVMGLRGFHDFRPVAHHRAKPQFNDPTYGLTLGPDDFATLYNTKPLLAANTDGSGINIAIIGQTWIDPTDLAGFRTQFGLTAHQTNVLVPGTGAQSVLDSNNEGEAELDLEWSAAVARGANIIFVYVGADTINFNVDDSARYIVEQGTKLAPGVGNGGAQIMSESYGGCDQFETTVDADVDSEIAAAANLEGITYVASSGDQGAAGCSWAGPGFGGIFTGPPADLPGVTGVGGTEFFPTTQVSPFFNTTTNVALAYPNSNAGVSLEAVWNDSDQDGVSGGGGAPSVIFPKPFYQQGVTPNDNARDVPDVSLTASQYNVAYETYEQGGLTPIGGTSASAPSFAGIVAILNQAVVAKGGQAGLGNINPMLYSLYGSNGTLKAFHDIVTGSNKVPCTVGTDPGCPAGATYGFDATTGYDLASGLGTIDAAKLVAAWTALSPTTTTITAPATATVGSKVTLTANVGSTASANGIGGTVTFTFETFAGGVGPIYGASDAGAQDESWLLGTVNVTALAGTPEKGSASLDVAIPPGLTGKAYVVAMYNGDSHYLPSHSSPPSLVTVSGSTLSIDPKLITLAPYAHTTLSTSGGTPPVTWTVIADKTCDVNFNCTYVEAQTPTKGYVQAGPTVGGTVTVMAIDVNGDEATTKITIGGTAVDAGDFPTFDAGPPGGPGNPPLADGGTTASDAGSSSDSGTSDAGTAIDSGTAHDAGTTTDSGTVHDAGSTTDSGTTHDAGTTADSGTAHDSGATTDSGTGHDSGTASDSGAIGDDSGSTGDDSGSTGDDDSGSVVGDDSGSTGDDGSASSVPDSSVPLGEDGGPVTSNDASTDGGSGGTGDSSGCGCVTAGSSSGGEHETQLGAFGVLAGLAAIGRRRRNRR